MANKQQPHRVLANATCGTVAFWKATSALDNGVFPSQWPWSYMGHALWHKLQASTTGGRMPTIFCGFAYSFLLWIFDITSKWYYQITLPEILLLEKVVSQNKRWQKKNPSFSNAKNPHFQCHRIPSRSLTTLLASEKVTPKNPFPKRKPVLVFQSHGFFLVPRHSTYGIYLHLPLKKINHSCIGIKIYHIHWVSGVSHPQKIPRNFKGSTGKAADLALVPPSSNLGKEPTTRIHENPTAA